MQEFALYGTPVTKTGKGRQKDDSQDLWEGGRVNASVMNDLLYRSDIIDNIVIDDGTWKPESFKSSRRNKRARQEEDLQKFMDDDDMASWEAKRVLVPVVKQRTSSSIATQFLQFVKWQQKKPNLTNANQEEDKSIQFFVSFQNSVRPANGSTKGLFTPAKLAQGSVQLPPAREKIGRKVKKQRINMKLSIADDYDVEDYTKNALPSASKLDESKPKFIPRSSRLLTLKPTTSHHSGKSSFAFSPSTKSILKYDTYSWPKDSTKASKSNVLESKEIKPVIKPEPETIPQDLSDFKITVQAFKKLSIVPPLDPQVALDALKADSFPFKTDLDKQQRYIYFLNVQANNIPNSSFVPISLHHTIDSWKHELNEFTQLALRYRPLSFELAQRFAPASTEPLNFESKEVQSRTVEKFMPAPLLLTRLGLPQIKEGEQTSDSSTIQKARPEPFTQPMRSDIVNLYENLSLTKGKKPKSLFMKIFKTGV